MGYMTNFKGSFKLDRPLRPEHAAYLRAFAKTRRMGRLTSGRMEEGIAAARRILWMRPTDVPTAACDSLPDPIREAVGLPVGKEGEFFVGGGGDFGQDRDSSIVDYNRQAGTQPGLWCQWVPTEDGAGIEWNGAEKFYRYVEWLEYLIANFLKRWGYVLSGSVTWQGECVGDVGKITVRDNVVATKKWEG